MLVKVLGCYGGDLKGRFPAFLINDRLLLDAGSIGITLKMEQQLLIDDILLTHQHIDHLVGLPFFLDSVYGKRKKPVNIYSSSEVLINLRTHLFNDIVWPDFTRLPRKNTPTLECKPIVWGTEYKTRRPLHFTAFASGHTADSCGYCIRENSDCLVYTGDCGVSSAFFLNIMNFFKQHPGLKFKALLIECSFPNEMKRFALKTKHLTPELLEHELMRAEIKDMSVYIFHMKPQYINLIRKQLKKNRMNCYHQVKPEMSFDLTKIS